MAFKLVISDPKSGLTVQKEATEDASKGFVGLKIGDAVKGELIDLHGYEFLLTGGSDFCGFPMRRDVSGVGRKKILAYEGIGIRKAKKGILQRKTVCGNTVHTKISQVNLKVTKLGTDNIFTEAGKKKAGEEKKGEAPAAAAPAEKKAPEKPKEQPKKEEATPKEQPKKEETKPDK